MNWFSQHCFSCMNSIYDYLEFLILHLFVQFSTLQSANSICIKLCIPTQFASETKTGEQFYAGTFAVKTTSNQEFFNPLTKLQPLKKSFHSILLFFLESFCQPNRLQKALIPRELFSPNQLKLKNLKTFSHMKTRGLDNKTKQ